MLFEQVGGDKGGEADDRADRQVDIPGQDHQRFANSDNRQNRDGEQDLYQVGERQELRYLHSDNDDDQQEDDEQTQLAHAAHEYNKAISAPA
jgi:hypothetical protein